MYVKSLYLYYLLVLLTAVLIEITISCIEIFCPSYDKVTRKCVMIDKEHSIPIILFPQISK